MIQNLLAKILEKSRRRDQKLDFKRNELARSLVMKRSNIIGVIVKDIAIPYMAEIIRGLEEVGRQKKYDIFLSSSYGNTESELEIVDFMFRKQAEGIIIVGENISNDVIYKLKENTIPYIFIDKFYDGDFSSNLIDYEKSAYQMTIEIIKRGHKNILFVKDDKDYKIEKLKYEGYKSAIREYGLNIFHINADDVHIEDGYNLGPKLLKRVKEDKISCIFAAEDDLAFGIINYFYDQKIRVPDDISVAGFGGSKFAEIYKPTLATFQIYYYDIGAGAMSKLIKILKNKSLSKDTVTPHLVHCKMEESVGFLNK